MRLLAGHNLRARGMILPGHGLRRGGAAFDPGSLFGAGDTGFLLDGRDGTLFTDAAGVTPAAINDLVQLRLDRSPNGIDALQTSSSFRATLLAAGVRFDGTDDRYPMPFKPPLAGTLAARFNAVTASRLMLGSQPSSAGRCFMGLDAFGRLAAGIGAQNTAVIRDQEADRRNLLRHTEDFNNSYWDKERLAITSLGGGVQRLTTTASATPRVWVPNASTPVGGFFHKVGSIKVRRGDWDFVLFTETYTNATARYAVFDIANKTVRHTGSQIVTASIVDLPGDWMRLIVSINPNTDSFNNSYQFGLCDDALTRSYNGPVGAFVDVRAPQLEPGTTVTAYQPIASALNDLRGGDHAGAVTWDGATVRLYLDGQQVYSAPQDGAVNTTVDMLYGALNNNGSAAAFWHGTLDALAIDRVLTPAEITKLHTSWSV